MIGQRIRTHAAAIRRGAADNIAAGHGQLPAGCDIHTAAIICVVDIFAAAELNRFSRTAGDDAAGDGFLAVFFVQHPQFAIRHEFVLGGGVAVGQRQIAAALDHNHAALVCAHIFEHMTV